MDNVLKINSDEKDNDHSDSINNKNNSLMSSINKEGLIHDEKVQSQESLKEENENINSPSPNFNILNSCLITNGYDMNLNEKSKDSNVIDNNNITSSIIASKEENYNSEQPQEMVISPILSFDKKPNPNENNNISDSWLNKNHNNEVDDLNNIHVQSSQNILDKSSINTDNNNLLDSIDSNVFNSIKINYYFYII